MPVSLSRYLLEVLVHLTTFVHPLAHALPPYLLPADNLASWIFPSPLNPRFADSPLRSLIPTPLYT